MANEKSDYLRGNEKKFALEMAAKRGCNADGDQFKAKGAVNGDYADKPMPKAKGAK